MISKKDLNSAELETVTKSRSPMTVITANGEVQTHEEATDYVRELDIFLTMEVLNTPAVLSLGKLCDEHGYSYKWINGHKPHLIKNGIRLRKVSSQSWFLVYLQLRQARLPQHPRLLQVRKLLVQMTVQKSSQNESVGRHARGDPFTSETSQELSHEPTKIPEPNKNEDHEEVRGDPYSDMPEWLQEFRENLVDERVLNTETHTRVLLMNHL